MAWEKQKKAEESRGLPHVTVAPAAA